MATKREVARDALYEKITEAVKEIGDDPYSASEQTGQLESLARAYALVNGRSEPSKSW